MNALRRIVRAIRVSAHLAQETSGISGAQLFVLQQLSEVPRASVNDLAERTLTDQSSVSVVVSRLVERQLVLRRTSARDGRRTELSLSSKGRALLAKAPETAQVRLMAALRRVARDDLLVVTRVLERLARDMGVERSVPSMFFEGEPQIVRREVDVDA